MAANSAIEWTDASWNPIVGCSLASPGCTNCYAMGEAARQQRCATGLGRATHYAGTTKDTKAGPAWTGKVVLAPARAGDFPAGSNSADGWAWMHRVGKKRAGRLLDGVEHNGMPEVRT